MAIAYDSSGSSGVNASSITYSHTCTGTDRVIILGVTIGTGATVSGTPTYAGVSMTLIGSVLTTSGSVFDKTYFYYLTAPATGANNVVVQCSTTAYIYPCSASYTGVDQTSPINVSNSYAATTGSVSLNVTTGVDNCWLVSFTSSGDTNSISAGANTTVRQNNGPGWSAIGDSNGAMSPAGSYGQTYTGTSGHRGIWVAGLTPSGGGGSTVNSNFFALM